MKKTNRQLAQGKHLLLTPGMYDVARSIKVQRANTVVPARARHADRGRRRGAAHGADVPGVVVAGLTVDAGTSCRRTCCGSASRHRRRCASRRRHPTTLSEVHSRAGGPHVGKAKVSLEINSDHC